MAKRYFKNIGRAYEDKLHEEGKKKTPMSGATWADKEDNQDEYLLIQAKATKFKSYTLKLDDLRSVVRNAAIKGKVGAMFLSFAGNEFVILSRKDFEHYVIFEDPINDNISFCRPASG